MNVYFISGLGADRRAFERLKLPACYTIHYLDWVAPQPGESLPAYAKRLAAGIDTSLPFAVVGLSMGGMIAASLSQVLPPHKTVLISSIACSNEFPPLLRMGRWSRAYKLLPQQLFYKPALLMVYRLLKSKKTGEREVMNYFVSRLDARFMKWAIGAILNWEDRLRPADIFHIHGTHDKILPLKYTQPDAVVKGGSHFMVWTKAGEVSRLLAEALAATNPITKQTAP